MSFPQGDVTESLESELEEGGIEEEADGSTLFSQEVIVIVKADNAAKASFLKFMVAP